MSLVPYTKQSLIERIQKHLNNGFPGEDWKISTNEMLLYIDTSIPAVMKGAIFDNAKVTGFLDVPEAYLVTYNYTITNKNDNTWEWYVTLAQPPLALPTGYDITDCYLADPQTGQSMNGLPISAKRNGFRKNLPAPPGFSYRIEGQTMFLKTWDGNPLWNYSLFVQLPVSRTDDLNAPMNLPDDAIDAIFTKVVQTILQRYSIPQDVIKDNLMPGNKGG
jgi:hypothetical protein